MPLVNKLLSTWRNRRDILLIWHNNHRLHNLSRRNNASVTYGRNIHLAKDAIIRLEGEQVSLNLGNAIASNGTSTIVVGGKGSLTIGDGVYLNSGVMISCLGEITIGENTLFGPQVNVFDNNHLFSPDGVERQCKPGRIRIGKRCWIAANVILLDGADIGDHCVIGAGCIIKGPIASGTIVTLHQEQHMHKI